MAMSSLNYNGLQSQEVTENLWNVVKWEINFLDVQLTTVWFCHVMWTVLCGMFSAMKN